VLVAGDASDAWKIWCSRKSVIQLALVDVRLPGGASGFDLEDALHAEDPSLPVIFTCGYSASSLKHSKELIPGENFLPKPFNMTELLDIVGKALAKAVKF
jgi:FixJ family two-component response regulator